MRSRGLATPQGPALDQRQREPLMRELNRMREAQ